MTAKPSPETVVAAIPTVIVRRAQAMGLSLDDVAAQVGVSPLELVGSLMGGNITLMELMKVAAALDTTPSRLAEEAEAQVSVVEETRRLFQGLDGNGGDSK